MNPESIVDDEAVRLRCRLCKTPLPRSRSDRKWCSAACAKAAKRARLKTAKS